MDNTQGRIAFVECEPCAVKPGHPTLCQSCLANRTAITTLEATTSAQAARVAELERCLNPRHWTHEQQLAWHRALPDLYAAFESLQGEEQHQGKQTM